MNAGLARHWSVAERSSGLATALATMVLALALAACGDGGEATGSGESTAEIATLEVSGSTTVNPVAADAAEILRKREGLRITVDTQGGSAGGIAQLATDEIDIAMSSKPISDAERAAHPGVDFVATQIGQDAVGIVVQDEVIDGGLRSITRVQLRALFEGRVKNWSELGGPNLEVFVYDKEPAEALGKCSTRSSTARTPKPHRRPT